MGVIRWQSAVDFLVLAVAIYLLLRWSRVARALRLALSIMALRVGALVAGQLGLPITGWVLDGATIVALLSLVVVFQPELRRALMRLDFPGRARQRNETPVVSAISAAAWALARTKCGALIVIVRRDAIAELVTTSVLVGGRVSAEILEAVFQKGGPVHDGAAIIEGDVLLQVGAVLPLTQRTDVPEQYGTRHRAAMGLAERSDALVLVVSEERGEVTVMSGIGIRHIHSEAELEAALGGLEVTASDDTSSRVLRALRRTDLRLAAAALGLSALVWSLTFLFPGSSVRVRTVPVELTNLPPGMTIASQSADTVEVWLRGSDFVFNSVNLEQLVARCDLKAAHPGMNAIKVEPSVLQLPLGLKVEGISPRDVSVRLASNPAPTAER
jgi:diadenylate cyclase